jgi:hypothetical protein
MGIVIGMAARVLVLPKVIKMIGRMEINLRRLKPKGNLSMTH